MRIAYFLDKFPLISETFVLAQICGAIARGHEVVVYANRLSEDDVQHPSVADYDLLNRTVVLPAAPERARDRLRLASGVLKTAKGRGRLGAALRCLDVFKFRGDAIRFALLIRSAPMIVEEPFDVLHCQFGQLGVWVQAVRQCGVIHGALVTSFRGTDAMKIAARNPGRFRQLFEEGERFLAVSHAVERRLIALGCPSDRISILRSGVDLDAFSFRGHSPLHDPIRVLTIARLTPIKGLEYALHAIKILHENGLNIEYRILGGGPLASELVGLSKALGIGSLVTFEGRVNTHRVREALAAADILVAPSITGPEGEQEGLPNSLKEAMATGVPAITTATGGIPELIEDGITGYFAQEKDAAAIAAKMLELVKDWGSVAAVTERARRRIQSEYDQAKISDELEQIYRELGPGSELK